MVYKAVHSAKTVGDAVTYRSIFQRKISPNGPRNPGCDRIVAGRRAGRGPVRLRRASTNPAQAWYGSGPAGGAGLLGSKAASGAAGSLPPHRDPVSDRNRLST